MSELDFKCPICKKVLIGEDNIHKCPHLAFIFVSSGCVFEFIMPEIKKLIKDMKETSEVTFDYMEELKGILPNNITMYERTETGIACGPCSITVWIGIKKATK